MVRTWKPTVAGILSIIGGAISILAGVVIITRMEFAQRIRWEWMWEGRHEAVAVVALVLGIVAVIGGIFAMRRQVWGLALAGAICALFPTPSMVSILNIGMGILAIVFVSLSRNEFDHGGAVQAPPPPASTGQSQ